MFRQDTHRRGGERKLCPPKNRISDSARLDQELNALGIKRSARNAIRSWIEVNPIHRDWTVKQLAEGGLCDRSQISRAIASLISLGLAVLKMPGCRGDQPKAAVYLFTEKLFLLRHCANRPSPYMYSSIPKKVTNKHKHETKQTLLDAVPDSWKPFWEKLLSRVKQLPGPTDINPRSLAVHIQACPLSPEDAFRVLDAAAAMAPTITDLRDPKAWILSCLCNAKFAHQAIRESQYVPPPKSLLANHVDVIQALTEEGLDLPGATIVTKELGAKIDHALLPFVLEAAKATLSARQRKYPVLNPKGMLVHLLRHLDVGILTQAKKLQVATTEHKKRLVGSGIAELLEKIPRSFRALPGADRALESWFISRKRLAGSHPDSPGYLDRYDEAQRAKSALAAIAKGLLSEKDQEALNKAIRTQFMGFKGDLDSPIVRRVMDGEVLRMVGLEID